MHGNRPPWKILPALFILLVPFPGTAMSASENRIVWDRYPMGSYSSGYNTQMGENALTIDPTDYNIWYIASTGAGVLKSTDGGRTWAPKNNGLPSHHVVFVKIRPDDHNQLYAGIMGHIFSNGGQVYRSFDGGETWNPTVVCDGQGDGQNMNICAWSADLQFDPSNSSRAYYGIEINNCRGATNCGGFYRTLDDFLSYEPNPTCVSDPTVQHTFHDNDIRIIRVDPWQPSVVHISDNVHSASYAMETSRDYGKNFYFEHVINTYNSFLPETEWYIGSLFPHAFDISYTNPSVMYADYGNSEVRRRTDNRVIPYMWDQNHYYNESLYPRPVPILLRADGERGASSVDGVGDNDEDGINAPDIIWRPVLNLKTAIPGAYSTPVDTLYDARSVGKILVHPVNENIVFLMVGAYTNTSPANTSWSYSESLLVARPSDPNNLRREWRSSVIFQTAAGESIGGWADSFFFHPSNPNILYMLVKNGTASQEINSIIKFETSDNWETWTTAYYPQENVNYWAEKIISAETGRGKYFFASTSRDIVISADGGLTWSWPGDIYYQPYLESRGIAVSPVNTSKLYVYKGRLGNFYEETSSGYSHTGYFSELSFMYKSVCTSVFNDLEADLVRQDSLWLATDAGLYRNTNLSYGDQGDYILNETGSKWERVAWNATQGLTDSYLWTVRQDPQNISRLLVGSRSGGIFSSDNGGLTWTNRLSATQVRDIELGSPYSLAAAAQGVYRSSDRGNTWEPTALDVQTTDVSIDVNDPYTFYAASDSGLYRSVNAGAAWENLNGAGKPPFVSVLHEDYYGIPMILFSGGGKGIGRIASRLVITRGPQQNSLRLRMSPAGSQQVRIYYGPDRSLSGSDADQGPSPVTVAAPLDFTLTGLDYGQYYISVSEINSGLESPRGFTHKAALSDTTEKNCMNTPSDPVFDVDTDGWSFCSLDCNDGNRDINPGKTEICGNGLDEDCDGYARPCICIDADGDGFGVAGSNSDCTYPYIDDCNDNNPAKNPGNLEICGNGISDDCDTDVDESCGYYYLEAEAENMTLGWNMTRYSDVNASSGYTMGTRMGIGVRDVNFSSNEANQSIYIMKSGDYHLWARLKTQITDRNSIFIGFDGSYARPRAPGTTYSWVKVETADGSGDYTHYLAKGFHILNIGHSHIAVRTDRLVITDDPEFVPVDTGTVPSPLPGDLYQDKRVNVLDLVIVGRNMGKACSTTCPPDWDARADTNGDFVTTSTDYIIVTNNFGRQY